MSPGKLYVVATPIGNLGDLSPRAVDVLSSVDVVAAEDTRVTRRLLSHAGIHARLVSYREENERTLAPRLVERLLGGENVALVSDAGTPCVSDPGYRLVSAAAEAGVEVVSVPGPSAILALLAASGLPTDRFAFEGFLPTASAARRRALAELAARRGTYVVYESPRRLVRLLRDIADELGDPDVAVGRELTKMHEEILRGKASELAATFDERGVRGELAIAIQIAETKRSERRGNAPEGGSGERGSWLERELRTLLGAGLSVRDAAARLKEQGVSRREVYEAARRLTAR